jgi:hypothetical protein
MARYDRPTIYDHLEALRKFSHRLDDDLTPAERIHYTRLVDTYTRLYVE